MRTGTVVESCPPIRNVVITKSSIEIAKTIIALAKMAGASSGRRTRRSAPAGDAPRSIAASSYSRPMANSLPRTTMTT
jgi:hypothetical protein